MPRRVADLILYNANVLTLDQRKPRAELVAVKGEQIIWVGANKDGRELEGQKIDCQGKTLIPGFIDAHCHILALASSLLSVDCSPPGVRSIADIKARIAEQAQRVPPGTWIRATGYNEFYLAEGRHPNRWDLDEAAPHHPVKLAHRSRHASVLNSLALSLVGISGQSPEPPGGLIDRELESGEPNGLLLEMEAYLDELVPSLSQEELRQGIRLASKECLSLGITSLQDATVHNRLTSWHTFRGLRERGDLAPRLWLMMGIAALEELKEGGFYPGYGDSGLRLGAAKIVLDETTGSLHPSPDGLEEQVLRAHQAGFQVAIHAIEERAIEAAARSIEKAVEQTPKSKHRHRIEHCSVCPPAVLSRLRQARAIVVTQPAFIYYSGERYLATVAEEQRRWLYRVASFIKEGLCPAAGSDSPVVPNNPLIGIYAAVTRRAETGQELLPAEGISPREAVEMYTRAAAYASFEEEFKGSIAAGKLADLVLLSDDPTQVPPEEIKDIQVEMTLLDGRVMWQRED